MLTECELRVGRQSNGICERFYKTVLMSFIGGLSKEGMWLLEELQKDLD